MAGLDLLRRFKRLIKRLMGLKSGEAQAAYAYRPGDSVVEDYAEFSHLPLTEVSDRIANFWRINAADWNNLKSRSFAERAAEFYENSDNFIFGILFANTSPQAVIDKLNRFNPAIVKSLKAHPGQSLLEFGGGAGVFCEIAARMGRQVYYMELPGLVFQFATWRFRKYGLPVTPIEAQAGVIHIPGQYDIVYTDAVIEHLPETLQIEATRALGVAVAAKGLLIFLVDLSGPTEEDPMHHEVDIVALHGLLTNKGLNCEDGLNTCCSLWRRP